MNKREKLQDGVAVVAAGRLDASQAFRLIPVALLLVILVVLSVLVPYFLSINNLVECAALGLMATGLTAVLITGWIDLSIPSLMSLSAVLGALCMRAGGNAGIACLLTIKVATAGGCINGHFGKLPANRDRDSPEKSPLLAAMEGCL